MADSKLCTITYLPLSTVQQELDKKHHQNYLHDYNNCQDHYNQWAEKRGYGSQRGHIPIEQQHRLFAEYKKHPEGEKKYPKSLNLFEYLNETCALESAAAFWYVYGEDDEESPKWVREILQEIQDTYGPLFPNGEIIIRMDK